MKLWQELLFSTLLVRSPEKQKEPRAGAAFLRWSFALACLCETLPLTLQKNQVDPEQGHAHLSVQNLTQKE